MIGGPGLVGFPSGRGGRDISPEEGAGSGADVPGRAGNELSVPEGGGKTDVSAGLEAGGRAGNPELSAGNPGATEEGWPNGAELSAGRAGIPESGAPAEGSGRRPELSEGAAGAEGGKPAGAELSPGKGGNPDEGLLSAPGRGGAALSPGFTG